MSTPLLVSRKQAAEALSVSVPTLCALIQRGLLRPVRIGSRVLLSWSELQRFAESGAASEQEVEQAADVAGLGVGEELSAQRRRVGPGVGRCGALLGGAANFRAGRPLNLVRDGYSD